MKKVILILIIILSFMLLNAQTITIHSIGFKSQTGTANKLQEGITINVKVIYSTVLMDNIQGPHVDEDPNKVWVDKFITLTPSINGYDSSIKISVSNYAYNGIGSYKYCTFDIICPNVTNIKSIQLRFGLYGGIED